MIYFDNAATTKISEESLNTYIEASKDYYNPSALYGDAGNIKKKIDNARDFFLKKLKGKDKSTFIFTGSATESNNAVLNSVIIRKEKKYIFSAGEHSSIYDTAKSYLEKGFNIVFIPLLKDGRVDTDELYRQLDESVAFVSLIHVSNETGAVNDIKGITEHIKAYNPNILVHSDGVQALGKIDINLKDLGVDYYTVSGHKINGPKGIGALYIANPNKFKPFIYGGGQEMGYRSGTENTPAILAFAEALKELKINDFSAHKKAILDNLDGEYIVVSDNKCVDNIISICFKGVRGETILHILESKGYLVGTGSACNSKAQHNRVISQLVPNEYLEGAIRLSFSKDVSINDCKNVAIELSNAAKQYKMRIKR